MSLLEESVYAFQTFRRMRTPKKRVLTWREQYQRIRRRLQLDAATAAVVWCTRRRRLRGSLTGGVSSAEPAPSSRGITEPLRRVGVGIRSN